MFTVLLLENMGEVLYRYVSVLMKIAFPIQRNIYIYVYVFIYVYTYTYQVQFKKVFREMK